MIGEDYQPSGDIRKDYMAFSELLKRTPRMDIIDNIHHVLVKSAINYDDEEMNDEERIQVEPKRIPIDEFSDMDADEIEKIQSEFTCRRPQYRFSFVDIVAFSKAISHVTLNFVALHLVSCGLSRKSLFTLGKALSHRKTLRFLSIEMNPFLESFDETDHVLADIPEVSKMESTLSFCTPSIEIEKKRKEEELSQQQQQLSNKQKLTKKSTKKNAQQDEGEKVQQEIETEIINRTYLTSSLGPIFMCSAKHVSLRGCDLTDDDAICIAELLSEDNSIISLNLWGNSITDRGGIALAKALRTNRVLLSISLAMNRITDKTVSEICKSLWNQNIYSEEEFLYLREKVFKSTYGTINLPRDSANDYQLILPSLPTHLRAAKDKKKTEKPKKITKIGQVDYGDGPIPWEEQVQRYDSDESASAKNSRTSSRVSTTASNGRKSAKADEAAIITDKKPVFNVPGNKIIRSINLSANVNVTDEGAGVFLKLPYIYLDRLNLSYCNVSNEMFASVSNKMNESPPEE